MIDTIAILLSIVSLIVTTIGFFASLKFYRDGVQLQSKANDALTKLEEKTQFIQSQVGGMFDKTLDAAIGRREVIYENFEELSQQLERTKSNIIDEALKQIGAVGEQERKRLTQLVNGQIELVREKVETTRESAERIALRSANFDVSNIPKIHIAVLRILFDKDGLTQDEVSNRIALNENDIENALHWLSAARFVEQRHGRYYIRPSAQKVL
jgi:uncharacterized protein YicC (UPF0701 family)